MDPDNGYLLSGIRKAIGTVRWMWLRWVGGGRVDSKADLEACLHRCGANDGWPEQRQELAAHCAAHRISCADILLLYESLVRQRAHNPGTLLPVILSKPQQAKVRIRDLRRGIARRKATAERRLANTRPVGPATPGSAKESYQSRLAYNLARDGSALSEISRVLDCTEARVQELINLERAKNQPPAVGS